MTQARPPDFQPTLSSAVEREFADLRMRGHPAIAGMPLLHDLLQISRHL